jgi:DUF1365 family protein
MVDDDRLLDILLLDYSIYIIYISIDFSETVPYIFRLVHAKKLHLSLFQHTSVGKPPNRGFVRATESKFMDCLAGKVWL